MSNDDEDIYQQAAQALLEYDAEVIANYSHGKPMAVYLAQCLYERHGPFELAWFDWAREAEDWYDETDVIENE